MTGYPSRITVISINKGTFNVFFIADVIDMTLTIFKKKS